MPARENDRRWALSGVVFSVLYVLGLIVVSGETPAETARADKVVSYFHDNAGKSRLAALLIALAAVSLIFFASHLRSALRRPSVDETLPSVVLGGGVVAAAGLLLMATIRFILVTAADNHQADVTRVLNVMDNNDFFVLVGGLATLLVGTGIALLGNAVLPRWFGYVSIVLGILALAGPLGVLAFFLAPLWALTAAIMLFRAGRGMPTAQGIGPE